MSNTATNTIIGNGFLPSALIGGKLPARFPPDKNPADHQANPIQLYSLGSLDLRVWKGLPVFIPPIPSEARILGTQQAERRDLEKLTSILSLNATVSQIIVNRNAQFCSALMVDEFNSDRFAFRATPYIERRTKEEPELASISIRLLLRQASMAVEFNYSAHARGEPIGSIELVKDSKKHSVEHRGNTIRYRSGNQSCFARCEDGSRPQDVMIRLLEEIENPNTRQIPSDFIASLPLGHGILAKLL